MKYVRLSVNGPGIVRVNLLGRETLFLSLTPVMMDVETACDAVKSLCVGGTPFTAMVKYEGSLGADKRRPRE
jgi:hypothetical protein